MFYIRVCEHLTLFSKRNLVLYFRVFMHIDARDETLSQTFCFIIGYPPYQCVLFLWHMKTAKRKENASYRAKLFGSNTDLDKIGQDPTPTKPKRNPIRKTLELGRKSISFEKTLSTPTQNNHPQPTPRSREVSADSNTAIVPSICFASSMPIYIGDQIIERNGAKCHQRFIDDFNRIKTKGAKVTTYLALFTSYPS